MDFLLLALAKVWPFLAGLLAILATYVGLARHHYNRGRQDERSSNLETELEARNEVDHLVQVARQAHDARRAEHRRKRLSDDYAGPLDDSRD